MRQLDQEVLNELKKVDEKLEVTNEWDIERVTNLKILRQSLLNDGHNEKEEK